LALEFIQVKNVVQEFFYHKGNAFINDVQDLHKVMEEFDGRVDDVNE
jgi:hypothetical protein